MATVICRVIGAITLALCLALGGGHLFWPRFTINTGSMRPAIGVGDEVILVRSDAYKPGDIVTVKSGGSYMTHRLKGFGPRGELVTRGDANQNNDPIRVGPDGKLDPLTAEDIQGKVVLTVPHYTWFLAFWMVVLALLSVWCLLGVPRARRPARPQGVAIAA